MTDPTPTDSRRATALLLAHLTNDTAQIAAIASEVNDDPRNSASYSLILALLELAVVCSPALQADDAPQVLRNTTTAIIEDNE